MKERINVSVDGRGYTKEVDQDLNSKAYALFGSGVGKQFLQYLESITTNNIYPAGTGIETLAHAEGARWVVGIVKARCEKGRKQSDG
jgi:hypothetical protein